MVSVRSSSGTMLSYIVMIIALIGCFALSVDAIRCHQCNSHIEEDCHNLQQSVPRGVRDNQYLKDCKRPSQKIERIFCRKIVLNIIANNEKRIVRDCGWNDDDLRGRNDTCMNADNEGFFHEICSCFSDGCNSAPMGVRANVGVALGLGIFMLIAAAVRSG